MKKLESNSTQTEKEEHVRENVDSFQACEGQWNIYSSAKIMLVHINEIRDVIFVNELEKSMKPGKGINAVSAIRKCHFKHSA